jgi:hypothetical protein
MNANYAKSVTETAAVQEANKILASIYTKIKREARSANSSTTVTLVDKPRAVIDLISKELALNGYKTTTLASGMHNSNDFICTIAVSW